MGTIRTGANGGFSEKAGSIIGSSWPDIRKQSQICLCVRQPATGNSQPATDNPQLTTCNPQLTTIDLDNPL